MKEKKLYFPGGIFIPSDVQIAESKKAIVYGYESQKLVVKEPKAGNKEYDAIETVIGIIRNHEEAEKKLEGMLVEHGARPGLLVREEGVIHQIHDGSKITYSRVQKWQKSSITLAEAGTDILKLPRQSLIDLRAVFTANIEIWGKNKGFLDIVGSSASKKSVWDKVLRHLLPIFYSENILIDEKGVLKIIDTATANNPLKADIKTKIRCVLQIFGSRLSIAILNAKLAFNNKRE
jgi:hypothetical protein